MEAARPSRTALRVALRRAAHQLYDSPVVFPDPIAVPILGAEYLPEVHRTATKLHKPFSVALRAFLVARSRYAEDLLAKAVTNGVTQYVLLGAGLDTFAYRNPYPNLHVYEVDHPATQAWKRALLHQSSIPIPPNLTYAPVDFEHHSLPTQLLATGFNPTTPTLFAMLGVVPYLTLEAFRSTISFIAAHPPGTGLTLDYGQPRRVLPFFEQLAHDSLASRVAQAGEPFQLFFTPAEIANELAAFSTIEDLGTPEINERYFAHRADKLAVRGGAGRLLSTWLN
jgi:methyltransferase (TIGR00027 family)